MGFGVGGHQSVLLINHQLSAPLFICVRVPDNYDSSMSQWFSNWRLETKLSVLEAERHWNATRSRVQCCRN